MQSVRAILGEIYGLFVDDVGLAVAIIVWLAIIGAGLSFHALSPATGGPILFLGLALILLERTFRYRK